ncbi:unnamed protein product [Mytilus edulis]|uniref:B box-type domain-containing protein n=1 Tax=Mytilus edulis TaxID=6550 RepID=A0A8S3V2V5_MYTED|nr:unnamed protein product [Mytilus edulis]
MAQFASKTCDICVSAYGSHYCLDCRTSSLDIIPEGKSKCREHNEEVSFVCKTCNLVVCSSCVTGNHTGHAFSKLLDSITQLKDTNTTDLRSKVHEATENITQMEEGIKAFDRKVEIVVKDIIEEGTRIKTRVDKCITQMVEAVKNQSRKERDKLSKIIADTKMNLKTGSDLDKKIHELNKTRNDGKLLQSLQKLAGDISKLSIEPLPEFPNIHYTYTVGPDTDNDIKQLFGIFKIR